jgi:hypothetical protein
LNGIEAPSLTLCPLFGGIAAQSSGVTGVRYKGFYGFIGLISLIGLNWFNRKQRKKNRHDSFVVDIFKI